MVEGIAPPDMTSPVGKFRILLGDDVWAPLDPPVAGRGTYQYFGDDQIVALLEMSTESVKRAVGYAYRQMAAGAAMQASTIATEDLRVSTEKRAADLLKLAEQFFADADKDDELVTAGGTFFALVSPGEAYDSFVMPAFKPTREEGYYTL